MIGLLAQAAGLLGCLLFIVSMILGARAQAERDAGARRDFEFLRAEIMNIHVRDAAAAWRKGQE